MRISERIFSDLREGNLKRYGIFSVTGDRYGAQWVAEAVEKRGVPYKAREMAKSGIYLEALPAFVSGQAELLDSPRLVAHSPVSKEGRPGTAVIRLTIRRERMTISRTLPVARLLWCSATVMHTAG